MADDHPAAVLAGLIGAATDLPWDSRIDGLVFHRDGRASARVASCWSHPDAALIVHLVNLAPKVVDLITAAEEWLTQHEGLDGCSYHRALSAALAALTVTPAGEGPGPT